MRKELTNHSRVDKGSPVIAFFKQSEHEGHGGRAQKNENQLVLELFQNQLPHGSRGVLGQG